MDTDTTRFEKLYNMVLDGIPSSVLLFDSGLRVVAANRNFLEKNRRSPAETLGHRFEAVFPDAITERTDLPKALRNAVQDRTPLRGGRLTYRAPGVSMRTYYYSVLPVITSGRVEGVLLLMDDVTEQIRLSEQVSRIERHLASVVESATDIVLSTDMSGRILTWNAAAERLTGYSVSEAEALHFFDLFPGGSGGEVREVIEHLDSRPGPHTKECWIAIKLGEPIPVHWVLSPLKDHMNRTIGMVAVGRDLTERRKYEAGLLQSQKLAALGVMAGGIAHEIRNPLAICSSSAQFLLSGGLTDEFRADCARKICAGIDRASVIIENLLKFAHPTSNRMNVIDLGVLLSETLALVSHHAKSNKIRVSVALPPEPVLTMGVATLLQQVFMNLFLNAIQAMPDGGELGVAARTSGDEAVVEVRDTGHGISSDDLGKVFDPFFTSAPAGKGTGLGLSICYSIVQQHKGAIEVESKIASGTAFTVRLPRHHEPGKAQCKN